MRTSAGALAHNFYNTNAVAEQRQISGAHKREGKSVWNATAADYGRAEFSAVNEDSQNGRNLGVKSRRPVFRRAFMGRKASGPMRGWPSKPFYNPEFMGACRCESRK